MKLNTFMALVAATVLVAACGEKEEQQQAAAAPVEEQVEAAPETEAADPLASLDQRISYIVGQNVASQFKRDGLTLDKDAFILAADDVYSESESKLSTEQIQQTVTEIQEKAQALQAAAQEAEEAEIAKLAVQNKADGEAYLAANGAKEGVTTTDSGLQYKEIVAGEGEETPTESDTVTVHYRGTLIDGTEFDSSYSRNAPATFPLGGVIPGWTEALQLMNVGDKFELVIPSDLAYGPAGAGANIGPNATLLFEVELLEIVKAPEDAANQ